MAGCCPSATAPTAGHSPDPGLGTDAPGGAQCAAARFVHLPGQIKWFWFFVYMIIASWTLRLRHKYTQNTHPSKKKKEERRHCYLTKQT